MHYVNGALALVLVVLSLLHLDDADRVLWMGLYGVGAMLAATTFKPRLNAWTVRVLATASALTMFLYFAGFLFRAPYLGEQWYAAEGNGGTLALLIGGFCMMPIVSAYSCRMKALHSPA